RTIRRQIDHFSTPKPPALLSKPTISGRITFPFRLVGMTAFEEGHCLFRVEYGSSAFHQGPRWSRRPRISGCGHEETVGDLSRRAVMWPNPVVQGSAWATDRVYRSEVFST